MNLILVTALLSFASLLPAEELILWDKGKITPSQPFKAKVIGVQPGWGWDTIILREKGKGRYCLVTFGNPSGAYTVIKAEDFDQAEMIKAGATFLNPGVEVDRFSWSIGIWKHGKVFGDEDSALLHFRKSQKAQNKSQSNGEDDSQPDRRSQ